MNLIVSVRRRGFIVGLIAFLVVAGWPTTIRAVLTNYINRPIMASGIGFGLMLKTDGTVWTWGNHGQYQAYFGQGGQVDSSAVGLYQTPFFATDSSSGIMKEIYPLPALRETNILGAVAVAAGNLYSLVLKWNGTVLAFGRNDNGQLGIGNKNNTSIPTVITNLSSVNAISAGDAHSMAVLADGTVKAWGWNVNGQLGIGNTTSISSPTNVIGLSNVVMVSCGYVHTLALTTSGTVWAWGDNSRGELGDGTTTSRYTPVLVTNLTGVSTISAGRNCSFAVLNDGTVKGWGDNSTGQMGLGEGAASYINKPTMVPGVSNICMISSAWDMVYALNKSGRLWGWGFGWPYSKGATPPGSGFTSTSVPTEQVNFPKMDFIGTFGSKTQDYYNLLVGGLCADGRIWNWGDLDHMAEHIYVFINGPVSTNIDWGYGKSYVSGPVAENAYCRGVGTLADFTSFVIPLDQQKGNALSNFDNSSLNGYSFISNYPTLYQYNSASSDVYGQTNLTLRTPFKNPIACFGSSSGGTPLYTQRSYKFVTYSGCPAMINDYPMLTNYDSSLKIAVYSKNNFELVGETNFSIPHYLVRDNKWADYLANGMTTTLEYYGLSTTLTELNYPNAYGVTNSGVLQLSHLASDAATNYIYVIKLKGRNGGGWMTLDQNLNPAWQPIYTLEFRPAAPWNIRFLTQLQFQNEPLPPFYDGKSPAEILTNSWNVTNVVDVVDIASCTNVDTSPELRSHPLLDAFVSQSKNDPLALARFVQNQIELTDAVDYVGNNQITSGELRLGGINRSALGVYLERQGSPAEQCSLLIYLLRKAGVPAVYVFPPTNGVKMLDQRLSKMLRVQLSGAINNTIGAINTNSLISVNYPWVAAYINNRWIHIFPWIKDTEIIQGQNLYDFMPSNYNTALKWVVGYLNNRPEIVSLGDTNDPPEILFQRFVQKQLINNAPGVSFDDLGIKAVNRQHEYNTWEDFPTPTWVAGTNRVGKALADSVITNTDFARWNPYIFPLGHVFNAVSVQVTHGGTNIVDTSSIRCCDVHGRGFLVYSERTNSSGTAPIALKLRLESFRPGVTNIANFTNDTDLVNNQLQSVVLPSSYTSNLSVKVTITRYRTTGDADIVTRSMPINVGDLNALCLNFGRVSDLMLEPLAEKVWSVERRIKQTPALTNSLTADQYQGLLVYLMGMSYYSKVDHFIPINAGLHERTPITDIGIGLAKLLAKRDYSKNYNLPDGAIVYTQPCVDMAYNERFMAEAPTFRSDSGKMLNFWNDAFNILTIADGSAKEHVAINEFFNQADAISTVKLLQLASLRHVSNPSVFKDILLVNQNNCPMILTNIYWETYRNFGIWELDLQIWEKVESAVGASPNNQAFVTPGAVTNNTGSYKGTGALIITDEGNYWALISGMANGGWGPYVPDRSFMNANLGSIWLSKSGAGNYSCNFNPPSLNYRPMAYDVFDRSQTLNIFDQANNNYLQYSIFNNQWAYQTSGYLGITSAGLDFNKIYANVVVNQTAQASLGWLGDALQQVGTLVADPVHAVTGEFYVDSVDLSLVGPLPLEIRRNYSSLNLADNQFGIGWKLSFTPYISVATNGTVMYAAEPDGSVLAYSQISNNPNLWIPTLARNPQLVNNRKDGIGSTANLLLSKIIQTNQSGVTNFFLYSPNGDVRNYLVQSFSISNVIDRTRPYLMNWQDARGNFLQFSYGTNAQTADYGELLRVDSSSGAYVQFSYDIYGHILRAFSNDGRQVDYEYDSLGDLKTVTLPDASEFKYDYSHAYQSVTNSYTANGKDYKTVIQQPYSLHLLTTKTDPEGRIIQNIYDSQRRVTNQAATVATDCRLLTNATFVYVNNFVLTNSITNLISGYTLVADVFGKITRYDYTNSRITQVTDPLNQTVLQIWYDENTNQPGYYPRSIWKSKDKRGLWTTFQYDSFGNITNTLTTGDLTGAGGTQTAASATGYNSNNLPVVIIDAIGNSNVFRYDPVFAYLPKEIVSYKSGQAIATNAIFYGNATNVVLLGNATWTNIACGLPIMAVRAYASPDAATNQLFYNGSGFITNQINYTATTDPAISNAMCYNDRGELYLRTDAAGRKSKYEYDGMGRTTIEEIFEANQLEPMHGQYYYYNHNGDISWYDGPQSNPEDYIWYDYDGGGRKVAEVHWRSQGAADGSGVQSAPADSLYSINSYFYDGFGNLIQEIDPVGNYSLMQYDSIGQLTCQVFYSASGVPLATNLMSHEAGGEVACFTNGLGGVTQTLYTQTGQPYFRQNPDGTTNGWQYDLVGRVQKEILPNGSYFLNEYDDVNRAVYKRFYNAANALLSTAVTVFDRRGNVITNVTARGSVFYNLYDGLERLKVAGGPPVSGGSLQQISTNYYDAAGVYLTNIDAVGRKTITQLDAAQRPVLAQKFDMLNNGALVFTQSNSYAADYHSVTTTTGAGTAAISRSTFMDSYNQVVLTQTYPTITATNYSLAIYDQAERLVASQDELGQTTTFVYDGLGRVFIKQLPDGATITNAYNSEGGLTAMVMPGGLTWSATYNSANQRTSEKLANGAAVNRQFTNILSSAGPSAGLMLSSIDLGRSITNTFVYDDYRRVAVNNATGGLVEHTMATTYQYEAGGLVTNLTQSSGINPTTTVFRQFDGYGQLTNESVYVGGSLQNTFGQQWDQGGHRSALISPTASFTYANRADGALTSVVAFGSLYSFTYDNSGLLASRSNPWRKVTVNARDGRGRLLTQATTVNGGSALIENLTWRPDSTINSYTATRSGAGAWNDSRTYDYNTRGQLITEPVGLSSSATATYGYGFDAAKLGVLTSAQLSGTLTNAWLATALNPLAQVTTEAWSGASKTLTASGWAGKAGAVATTLDGQPVNTVILSSGSWYADLVVSSGAHTLAASAYYPAGLFTNTAVSSFTVIGSNAVTNQFDATGYVTNRLFTTGQGQTLTFDGAGRLLRVAQRDSAGNGFNWSAVYDALGRRLTTTNTPVTNGIAINSQLCTINSYYDPQVEFEELGVSVNGQRTWQIMGPDLNGSYGGLNGVGGVEATAQETGGLVTPVLNDYFGNVLATITPPSEIFWSSQRVGGYGPVGYLAPVLSTSTPLAQSLVWRTRRMDPSGFYNLGARYYDPVGRHFVSPDPLGQAASMDLYSFCGGDPINGFDADGRFGKSAGNFGLTAFESQMQHQLDDVNYAISSPGQYMQAYRQTQADVARTLSWQATPQTSGQFFSSLLNMTPVVGALKMWWEGGFSGKDMVTGKWIDRSGLGTVLGVTANAVGTFGMMSGVMNEAAQGARFSEGFAGWQARSAALEMQMAPRSLGAAETTAGKFSVGIYDDIRGTVPGMDAHHVGQKAVMGDLIPGYDPATAPSILVPKVGHTIRGPNGIVSRSTEGFTSARDVIARDIRELRRVYPDVPTSKLQELIQMNKDLYPSVNK